MIGYFSYLLYQTINGQEFSVVTTVMRNDVNTDTSDLLLTKDNFDVAIFPFMSTPIPGVNASNLADYVNFAMVYNNLNLSTGLPQFT